MCRIPLAKRDSLVSKVAEAWSNIDFQDTFPNTFPPIFLSRPSMLGLAVHIFSRPALILSLVRSSPGRLVGQNLVGQLSQVPVLYLTLCMV